MSDEMIDSLLAGDTQAAPEAQTTETPEGQVPEADQPQDQPDPWPKSAENALNRAKKNAAKYKAQSREAEARLAEMSERIARLENPPPKEPREEDYGNYGDYLKAIATYRGGEQQPQPQEKPLSREDAIQQAREELHFRDRIGVMQQQTQQAIKDVPDYIQLHAEYGDVLEDMPQGTVKAFMGLDNAPAAFYALAKQGLIEALPNLDPTQAAILLARAEAQGEQMFKAIKTQTTKAPPPMKGVSGTASVRSDDELSGKELLKKYGR